MEGEVLPYLPSGRLSSQALRRSTVVDAFHTAFQMIGGVPRLALWADQNPGEFYRLYSRLLPSQSSAELDHAEALTIHHALPPPRYDPAAPIYPPTTTPTVDVDVDVDDHGNS